MWLGKVYWAENIVWSPGYFLSTVGVDEERIIKCVDEFIPLNEEILKPELLPVEK